MRLRLTVNLTVNLSEDIESFLGFDYNKEPLNMEVQVFAWTFIFILLD